jgi:pyroglutamyl-peptidase
MSVRILVTGFGPFPGAPVNPSEVLIRQFRERGVDLGADVVLEAVLLETSYLAAQAALTDIGAAASPDIALHFGLARSAKGFRLERTARNVVSCTSPDAAGYLPRSSAIHSGKQTFQTSLPLDRIHRELSVRNIPVEFSDDAGAYVCNFIFYCARGGLFGAFGATMCGFIHLPYLDSQVKQIGGDEKLASISADTLWNGAVSTVETCLSALRAAR